MSIAKPMLYTMAAHGGKIDGNKAREREGRQAMEEQEIATKKLNILRTSDVDSSPIILKGTKKTLISNIVKQSLCLVPDYCFFSPSEEKCLSAI